MKFGKSHLIKNLLGWDQMDFRIHKEDITLVFSEQITNLTSNNQCAGSKATLTASQITFYSWSEPSGFSRILPN